MSDRSKWLVVDPENGETLCDTEAEARSLFDEVIDHLRDEAAEGWHENAEGAALYRCHEVARLRLKITASAEDQTEGGEACRRQGWDFMAEGEVVEVSPAAIGALVVDAVENAERAAYEAGYRQGWRNGRCDRDEGDDTHGDDPGESYEIWANSGDEVVRAGPDMDGVGGLDEDDDYESGDYDYDGEHEDERRAKRGTSECDGLCDPMCRWCLAGHDCPDQCGGGDECPYNLLAKADEVPRG